MGLEMLGRRWLDEMDQYPNIWLVCTNVSRATSTYTGLSHIFSFILLQSWLRLL